MTQLTRARLGEVLRLDVDSVAVNSMETYATAGVRSFGRGLFLRGPVTGAESSYKTFNRLKRDQIVLSRLFAWEGAVSLVPPDFDGVYVSTEFPTFAVDLTLALPAYVGHFVRWPQFHEQLAGLTRGLGQRRKRVHAEQLLECEIPLPPLDVQRESVERLDAVTGAVAELSESSRSALKLSDALAVSLAARPDLDERTKRLTGWEEVGLGSVMVQADNKVKVTPDGVYPNLGILSYGRGLFEKPDIDGSRTSAAVLNQVRSGQFIYSRLFAFEGAYAYVPPEFDGRFVSNEFPTFDPNPDLLDARWLANVMRSPSSWAELRGSSKGLGVRRQRVPVEAILSYRIWLPPIETQKSMVAAIDRIESIQAARVDVERRTAALIPAELNRAFAEIK